MTMVIGDRKIVGVIKKRAEARAIYDLAISMGQTAALLDQERPNIFTQTVGNIDPKQEIKIEISYIDVLKYDLGTYEFHFPVVVGPRYIPGGKDVKPNGPGLSPTVAPTPAVPDANRITPPYTPTRNGSDIALSVKLDAGVAIQELKSSNHEIDVTKKSESAAEVKIKAAGTIPNKDFVLRYKVMGKQTEMALLSHHPSGPYEYGYYMLMIQPHEDEALKVEQPPREMVFMLDVSGSMNGQPTDKNKEMMREMLALCRPIDTVQVITFANQTSKLFEKPLPVTNENINKALAFTNAVNGGGGTEMLKGINLAINEPLDKERRRIVVMLTDGFIGNEAQVIEAVGKGCGDNIRFWCVGIGSAPNMMLIDGVAKQGGGMGKKIALTEPAKQLATELMFRIQSAQLSKIKIDYGTMNVNEQYPPTIGDLWFGQPIVVYGRYTSGKTTTVTVNGEIEGKPTSMKMNVAFPDEQSTNNGLSKIWARKKIEDLMQSVYYSTSETVEQEVTGLALEFGLMSQYTSFVAVDDSEAKLDAKPPRKMAVPLPIPEGTRWEGFFDGDIMLEQAGMLHNSIPTSSLKSEVRVMNAAPALAPQRQSLMGATGVRQRSVIAGGGRGGGGMGGGMGGGGMGTMGSAAPAARASSLAAQPSTPLFDLDDLGTTDYRVIQAVARLHSQSGSDDLAKLGKELLDKKEYAQALDVLIAWQMLTGQESEYYEDASSALLKQLAAANPVLNRKLTLVVRNQTLADALKAVDPAIVVEAGALQDSADLLLFKELRVPYADLNGLTVAEALDELLTPMNLRWTVNGGKITVYSIVAPDQKTGYWVYSLTRVPWMNTAQGVPQETFNTHANSLTDALKKELKIVGADLKWTQSGSLLLKADKETHGKFIKLLSDLADPNAKLTGDLAALQKTYVQRIEDRKIATREALLANADKLRTAGALNEYGWRLLTAAARKQLDDEAICHLADALKSTSISDIAKQAPVIILRTAWIANQTASSVTIDNNKVSPSQVALNQVRDQVNALAKGLSPDFKSRIAAADTARAIYYCLLFGAPEKVDFEDASGAAVLSSLTSGKKADYKSLLLGNYLQNEDLAVLSAIACRRNGSDAWNAFRSDATGFANYPISSDVVVLIHNLSGNTLAIVKQ